ncbi:hypothetical protein C2E20_8351 [Micractinium conductrix]|uniref:Uncharacterized protein n=1 Tax=Micractinium conductrix TaxID=554055 RepID=A0A2P6V1U0_9CHLO|nr:hypothetical protein C2E20_8351 [Micractinium conductrix]|eukprot:PSC68052.1 hypothetical protein C2E20_8351 [Micractinium conductrix]
MLRLAAWMYPLLPLGHTGTAARGIAAAAAARCPAITHGYNDSEEMDVSEAALQEEAAAARRATEQCGSTSEHDMARAIAHDSREAAAEHAEDASDASGVQRDTLTDRKVLEGGSSEGQTTSV